MICSQCKKDTMMVPDDTGLCRCVHCGNEWIKGNEGDSQLDRIEAKLDQLLSNMKPTIQWPECSCGTTTIGCPIHSAN